MNEAAAKARGDILVFLHADVIPPSTFIKDISDTINEGFSYGYFSYKFEPSSFMLNINALFTHNNGLFAGGGDQIHFMTRELFLQMGGYDESYCIMEDFDFTRRVKKSGKPIKLIKNPAVVSSRKYKNNSWLKVNLLNLIAYFMFKMNFSPKKIRKLYYGQLTTNDS